MDSQSLIQIFGSILLAFVPAAVWGYIFYVKNPYRRSVIFYAFFLGATAVFPILFYKYLWQFFPWINAFTYTQSFQQNMIGMGGLVSIPLNIIFTFAIVGVIEEFMKHVAVRAMGQGEFHDLDDVIELSILCALGFSFTENIMYFHSIWMSQGPQNLLVPFVFRSIFSSFAHILFSGILGYYYGLSYFSTPILREQKRIIWPKIMEQIFGVDDEKIYAFQNLVQGFLIAATLHAIFNVLLEMEWTILLVPFLLIGYVYLTYLFEKKENQKKFGHLTTAAERVSVAENSVSQTIDSIMG